eukprot:TRINITY_DN1360_c0_g1_i1.p1 TRINITY_DN1360_c0_g1~~TRINITY_DN1360_c0_g1_i1.p1  ORF type:complete len:834 (+),score=116.60 TRINITY_DN1360_c0_g1_i1:73-2502(+)
MPFIGMEQAVLGAFLLHDLGWVSRHPLIGLPGCLVGLSLQLMVTRAVLKQRDLNTANELSMLLWLAGNCVWNFSEYLWDEATPAGFLANVDFLRTLSNKWYPPVLLLALIIQSMSVLFLLTCYIAFFASRRKRRSASASQSLFESSENVVRSTSAIQPIMSDEVSERGDGLVAQQTEPANVCWNTIPVRIYYELFCIPWIFMDSLWSFADYDIMGYNFCAPFIAWCCVCFGSIAVLLTMDCVRRQVRYGDRFQACLSIAECCWVSGNLVWMADDLLLHWELHSLAVTSFACGIFVSVVVASLFRHSPATSEESQSSAACDGDVRAEEYAALQNGARMEAGVACCETRSHAVPEPASLVSALNVPHVIGGACVDRKKKTRRHASLTRGVVVLPPEVQDADLVKIATALDLQDLANRTKGSVSFMDLGRIGAALFEWNSHLQRVSLYHSTRCLRDEKVMLQLRDAGCCIACSSVSDAIWTFSLGVPQQDVILDLPYMSRTHLSGARSSGVRLLLVNREVDFRKIKAEFPTAQLILQVDSFDVGSELAEGNSGGQWRTILAAACELGLNVAGVSPRATVSAGTKTSPRTTMLQSLEVAVKEAKEVFAFALQLGMAPMSLLELGCINESSAESFAPTASDIEALLARELPPAEFPGLRIIAEARHFISRHGVALMTKVISKESWTQGSCRQNDAGTEDGVNSAHMRYTLNDGLCGSFSCATADALKVTPTLLRHSEGGDQEKRLLSSFVGQSGQAFDVIIPEVMMPELAVGECIIWSSTDVSPAATEAKVCGHLVRHAATTARYYTRTNDALF